jgi:hypothetical protein
LKASHCVEIFLTFALLCVGGSQAYIYWRQAGIMQTQAEISDNQLTEMKDARLAMITSERADIVIDAITIAGWPMSSTDAAHVLLIIKNGGKKTGFIVRASIALAVGPTDATPPDEPNYRPDDPTFRFPVVPSDASPPRHLAFVPMTDLALNPIPVSESEIGKIALGADAAYVYGFIEYTDEFSPAYGTKTFRFCSVFDKIRSQGSFLNQDGSPLLPCNLPNYIYSRTNPTKQ